VEHVRTVLHVSRLLKTLWGEALLHIVWVKHRSATRALDGKIPYEMLYGKKPHLGDLPVWGSKYWVLDCSGSKLDDRATEGHWVGYNSESTAHQIYLPDRRAVIIERNVTFWRRDKVASTRLEDTKDKDDQCKSPAKPANNPEKQSVDHLGDDFENPNQGGEQLQRSGRQWFDSPYISMLQSVEGTHDG
jgi:hypothetical protein